MSTRKSPDHTQQYPMVHVAPPGKLIAYTVLEHELDIIAAGSPANLAFNFAVAMISIGVSVLTLTTITINSNHLFIIYSLLCIVCPLAGIIMFACWPKTRTSVNIPSPRSRAD